MTTPPCSEIVEWIITNDPKHMSEEQLEFFHSRWADNETFADGMGNNRITQQILERKIYIKREDTHGHSIAMNLLLSLSALSAFYMAFIL